jgi:hypothetical protein
MMGKNASTSKNGQPDDRSEVCSNPHTSLYWDNVRKIQDIGSKEDDIFNAGRVILAHSSK